MDSWSGGLKKLGKTALYSVLGLIILVVGLEIVKPQAPKTTIVQLSSQQGQGHVAPSAIPTPNPIPSPTLAQNTEQPGNTLSASTYSYTAPIPSCDTSEQQTLIGQYNASVNQYDTTYQQSYQTTKQIYEASGTVDSPAELAALQNLSQERDNFISGQKGVYNTQLLSIHCPESL